MKFLLSLWIVAIGIVAVLSWELREEQREHEGARRTIAAARYSRDSVLNINAQLMLRVPHTVDTVRLVVEKVRTLRDSVMLRKWDTVLVERLVWQVDSLRARCLECAALLDTIRQKDADEKRATESYVSMLRGEVKRKDKLLEFGPRFQWSVQGDRSLVVGDLRIAADADVRLLGRIHGYARAEHTFGFPSRSDLRVGIRARP